MMEERSSICAPYWADMDVWERMMCDCCPIYAVSQYRARKEREAMASNSGNTAEPTTSPPAKVSCDKKCIAFMVAYVGGIIASFLILNLLAHMLGINPFAVMP